MDPGSVEARIAMLAESAATKMERHVTDWEFMPANLFVQQTEFYVSEVDEPLALYLAFLCLTIRDVMHNLSGAVPYGPHGARLDVARANVYRAIRATLEAITEDITHATGFAKTAAACGVLARTYSSEISHLNQEGA